MTPKILSHIDQIQKTTRIIICLNYSPPHFFYIIQIHLTTLKSSKSQKTIASSMMNFLTRGCQCPQILRSP
jgi:hypothetical protein